ncbi:hypothetical protein B0H14DRAFT_2615116 [Mycena olivaceomarginata]|nr:hypothetical protein B0H14DRAFT_2615116 [Mycena olivaceomarginata]
MSTTVSGSKSKRARTLWEYSRVSYLTGATLAAVGVTTDYGFDDIAEGLMARRRLSLIASVKHRSAPSVRQKRVINPSNDHLPQIQQLILFQLFRSSNQLPIIGTGY